MASGRKDRSEARKKDAVNNVSKYGQGQIEGQGGHFSEKMISVKSEKPETDSKLTLRYR